MVVVVEELGVQVEGVNGVELDDVDQVEADQLPTWAGMGRRA